MRLSKLHISGFKSFAERAELGFDDGVTAIVGPNGCGKSNVVDAITWVLGEQSARSLRGERMEDVIFGGSEGRKPTAAAEVRLAFTQVRKAMAIVSEAEDRDGDPLLDGQPVIARDVEIGRRLYRSGESEYLIDGEICRLRDIHDLLMDSGLGVKAYAVIEQGKIGQILSSRPAERRMLIEEAAGVTKYKARRRSAELKLEAAQQNLTRVDDVIYEVEKQRNALKRQAARARRYRTLREELRTWEQVQTARRYDALREAIEQAGARLDAAREKEVLAAARIAELESAIEAVRLGLTSAEARATSARDEAHGREMAIGRRQQQIEFDEQQIVELGRQAEAFALEADGLEARRAPLQESLAAEREAAARARETLDTAQATVDARDAAYREAFSVVQSIEQAADQERAAVMAAATTLSALAQARDHAAAVRDRVAADRERLEIEARELGAEVERAGLEVEAAERAIGEARAARDETAAGRQTAEADVAVLDADRVRLTQTRAARERELAGREARLRSLEELEARRATFGDAARLLLSGEAGTFGHHGAVADHLTVERSYEKAAEALLGDLLQYVIVDTATDAAAGLALVAERQAGRCGFVVLDALAEAAPERRPVPAPAGARALSDVVSVSGPHKAALERLLEDAWVVESFAAAEAAAREGTPLVAALTGEVCGGRAGGGRAPWKIEGGAHQGAHGILEVRAEIQQLRQESDEIARALEVLSTELTGVDERLTAGRSRVADLVASLHTREKEIVGIDARLAHARNERERLARRLEVIATERARAIEEQQATETRREESIAAIVAHESKKQSAEQSLGEVLARLQQGREAAEASMQQVAAARAEQAGLAERVSRLDAEVARLERDAVELDERLAVRRADVERLHGRVAELRESVAANRAALDEDVHTLDGLKAAVVECDTQVAELRREFEVRDGEVRVARQALDGTRAEVMQAEVARTAAAGDLSHLASTCTGNFGLSLEDVARTVQEWLAEGRLVPPQVRTASSGEDEADDDEGAAEAAAPADSEAGETETETAVAAGEVVVSETAPEPAAPASEVDVDAVIALLRGRIDRLGPVNMMAIEQFDELEERHTFLTAQRQDLLDSIAQTGEAIRRIDKTTRERFSEAFTLINQNFESTFTTLFGGGRAGLVLIDQENEQESGIDIIAQPPGKRLQNVQLLSGGEKALTAMALMFAIFKHRPSPFCLLDEIDAPLDDANIGRFVEMLQGMQEHTQFILITHNRKTMEIADRLYGVTMEEPGVSKLISVQLN